MEYTRSHSPSRLSRRETTSEDPLERSTGIDVSAEHPAVAGPHEYEKLPFPPGASPFHLKGIVYRAHIEYANEFVPGGTKAVNAAFRNRQLAAFFEQPFLAASWYDALPIVPVWHVCARLSGLLPNDFLKARTKHQAKQDISGVYKLILNLTSVEQVALRMPRVVGKYFDFGTTDAKVVRPGVVHYEQAGMPALMAQWLSIVGDTYLHVALETAGAKKVRVRRIPIEECGEMHGVPLVKLSTDVEFDVAAPPSEPRPR
jgi:hypothetical protein